MRVFGFAAAVRLASVPLILSGCAATTPTSKVAVDYNRIFAKARNEVLVTNILRASAREPLQFSTMGSVNGGVRNTGSVDLTIPSLIGRGATILSPDFTVNEGINPNVTIVPLSSKEFTQGILKPVTLDEVSYFINQSWDQELIFELVVGGLVCPDGHVIFNHGNPDDPHYGAFAHMFAASDRFPIAEISNPKPVTIRMSASEAISVMKDGVGPTRKVDSVTPFIDHGKNTGLVDVTIISAPTEEIRGLNTKSICSSVREPGPKPLIPADGVVKISSPDGEDQGKVILRSVEAIIYFLGETQRWRWDHGADCRSDAAAPFYLRYRNGAATPETISILRIERACPSRPLPAETFVQTHFEDADYYVLRQANAGDNDRTLSTLSFLAELIELQTSESSITAATPLIAIGTK